MKKIANKTPYIVLAIITFVTLLACSFYTYPAYRVLAFDQDIFYVIGRNWAEGEIPYITAWDSKGPFIFFFNMLGYMMTKNEMGVFILETLNFILVVWCGYYFSCKYCNKKEAFLFTLCFITCYVIINSGGNQVGDCSLLLSTISVFLTYQWSRKFNNGNIILHPYKFSIIYGMYFTLCLLSRLTNAMLLCASIFVIFCILIYHRQWKNLFQNAIAFILGSCALALPFIVYFYYHHALYDMWYATLLYNIEYALHSHPDAITDTHFPIVYFGLYNICLVSIVFYSFVTLLCKDKRKVAYIWLPIVLITMAWIIKSYANANYTISFLPVLFVALIELSTLYHNNNKKIYKYSIYCLYFISLIGTLNYIRASRAYNTTAKDLQDEANHQIKMINSIPSNDTFIIYNGLPYVYATLNIHPYYPYWICQDWAIENGISLRQKVRKCYLSGNVKWIVIFDYEHSNIKDILLKKYSIYKEDKTYKLTLFKIRG